MSKAEFSGNFGKVFGEFDKLVGDACKVGQFHQPIIAKLEKAMAEAERVSLQTQRQRKEALQTLEQIENGAKTATAAEYADAKAQLDYLQLASKRAIDAYAEAHSQWQAAIDAARSAGAKARADVLLHWKDISYQAGEYLEKELLRGA